jgi:tetratricopeptide (TPR) repeat protein
MNTGWTFLDIGDYERALKYFRTSIDLRPICSWNVRLYFRALESQGKYDESQHFVDSVCNVTDCDLECARLRFHNLLNRQEYGQAEMNFKEFLHDGGLPSLFDSIYVAYMYKKLDRESEAVTILERIRSLNEPNLNNNTDGLNYYIMAAVYCQLGNKEKALSYLSRAVDHGLRYGLHDFSEITPPFEPLHDDVGFKAILKRAQEKKAVLRAQVQEMIDNRIIDP